MSKSPMIAVVMGSRSDWPVMQKATDLLSQLGISYRAQVVSAHRTPDWLFDFAQSARKVGYKIIIAAAGGAAHLPGMIAAKTTLPVIGVPIQGGALNGLDALLSIVQMPAGIPVATVAIGEAGAKNAALLAAAILSSDRADIADALAQYRQEQTQSVLENKSLEEVGLG